MAFRVKKLIKSIALVAEMVFHAGILALIAAAMIAEKAGAYLALQFLMDIAVMFAILVLMLFKYKHRDAEPSRVPNVTCFSIIFLLSLIGATGLTIRATSGGGFCEQFLSAHPERCMGARLAIALSWISVIIAIAGILASWLDRRPRDVEMARLYAPSRSAREIELLKRQSASAPTNALPSIYTPRRPAPHAASYPQGPHLAHDPRQLVPAQTIPGHSQKVPSHNIPSYLPSSSSRRTSEPTPLMLHREVNGPVGQAPRNQPTFMPIDDPNSTKLSTQKAHPKDIWKQKYLA